VRAAAWQCFLLPDNYAVRPNDVDKVTRRLIAGKPAKPQIRKNKGAKIAEALL
jgi:hypothetical protein